MKISHTAAYIAVKFYGLTLDPKIRKHFTPGIIDFYEKMVRFLPKHLSWYHDSLTAPLWRKFFIFSEEALLPGDLMHIISRKYYITRKVEESLAKGTEQVVILGSGFDHLGVYISDKGIPVFELDTEIMIDEKRRFLDENTLRNSLLHLEVCDVTQQRVGEVLRNIPRFDPKLKTLFVAEGFFDYLSLRPSEHILQDIRELNHRNSLLTTFFSIDELNLFHRFVFTSGVSLVGESLKFKLNRDEFVDFLEEMYFSLTDELDSQTMRQELIKKMGSSLPVLKGFYIQEYEPRKV